MTPLSCAHATCLALFGNMQICRLFVQAHGNGIYLAGSTSLSLCHSSSRHIPPSCGQSAGGHSHPASGFPGSLGADMACIALCEVIQGSDAFSYDYIHVVPDNALVRIPRFPCRQQPVYRLWGLSACTVAHLLSGNAWQAYMGPRQTLPPCLPARSAACAGHHPLSVRLCPGPMSPRCSQRPGSTV